jgi:hypothetical protein
LACRGHKHRQKHRQEQPYRATELDAVLDRARQVIARYGDTNNGEN